MPDMRFAPPNPLRIADRASGLNAPTVRSYNERLVLSLLLQSSGISRLEIGEKTGLSAQTVSVIVRSLEQEALVSKGEAQRGRVGPPTIPLSLNPEGAFSVGVSFGEDAANVALIDFVGRVRYHAAHLYSSLQESPAAIAAKIEEGLLTLPPASRTRVAGVGLAVPDDGNVSGRIRKLLGRDLADAQANIERKLGLSVYIQNEITAAAGGESLFGMARSLSDFLFFYLGSRLHSRLILNYQIHSGRSDLSHDVGLLALHQGLKKRGLALSDIGSEIPAAADELYTQWQQACSQQILESVRSLLSFVNFKSVVLSSYAPPVLARDLCERLRKELPDVQFLLGANTTAPKAIGAASLPYHSRFMVQ